MQGFYEFINGASILDTLRGFLTHEDPNVRAKACNALGNMCRHSAYFYDSLVSTKPYCFVPAELYEPLFYNLLSTFYNSLLGLWKLCWR